MAQDEKYNGYTNYETWNFNLWEDSDYWHERAQEVYNDAESDQYFTKKERAMLDLADSIKDYIEEMQEMQETPVTGFFADILNAAIREVNCHELAELYMDDIEEEEEEEEEED